MKLAYEPFSTVIETSEQMVAGIIVENPSALYKFLSNLRAASEGHESSVVLSCGDKVENFSKKVDLLTDFIRFDLNQKSLLTKVIASMDQLSENEAFYERSRQLLSQIETLLLDMSVSLSCDFVCEKLNMQSVIKAAGISLVDDSTLLEERILTYMNLARDFLGKKVFILVNVRGLIPYSNLQLMTDTALLREHELIFVDNMEYPKLMQEKRLVIDADLCEI